MELPHPQLPRPLHSLTTMFVVVAGLYFARELLIPFALAFLMAPTLAPPIALLERCRLGRVASVLVVVILACAILGSTAWLLTQQVADLMTRIPEYRENIIERIDSLRGGMIEKATDAVKDLGAGITTSTHPQNAPYPQEVRVVPEALTGFDTFMSKLGFLFGPLGTFGAVLVIVTFLLLQRGDLRDRIVHLIGDGRVHLTTKAMTEITARVSKYLRTQAAINVVNGVGMGLMLWLCGVPNALVWGILAALLSYVPYVGPLIAIAMPIAVALAVFEGWERPLMVAGLLVGFQLFISNVVEPRFYGRSAGVSSLAVIVSAMFWAWIWGPVGLVVAMPLTVALVVIGKHVPQLHFLDVLLAKESRTPPSVRVYQRLLAMSQVDLSDIAERELAESKSLVELCDTVLLPALALAEFDRRHSNLPDFCLQFIEQSMRELIEDLGEQSREIHAKNVDAPTPEDLARSSSGPAPAAIRVLCVPTKNALDRVVGLMLCQTLEDVGIACQVASADAKPSEGSEPVTEQRPDIVCISSLPPAGLAQARYLTKRLRARLPEVQIVAGVWGSDLQPDVAVQSLRLADDSAFVTTLAAARDRIKKLAEEIEMRRLTDSPAEISRTS